MQDNTENKENTNPVEPEETVPADEPTWTEEPVAEDPAAAEVPTEEPAAEEPASEADAVKEPAEETPAEETASVEEEAPAEETAPVEEETPAEETTPAAEETLAEENLPVEEAPAEGAAPVEEPAPAKEPAEKKPAEKPVEKPSKKKKEKKEKPEKRRSRIGFRIVVILLVLAAIAAAALCVIYFQGREYFRTHFAPNTYVNGEDVSSMEMQPILNEIRSKYPTKFVIHEKNNIEETIDFSTAIENKDVDQFVAEQSEKAMYWYRSLKQDTVFNSSDRIEINEESFKSMVKDALNSVKRKESKDAYIDIKKMAIVPEEIGNELNVDEICEKAFKEADENHFEVTVDEDEYFMPKIYRDDDSLTSVIEEYEKRIDRTIDIYIANGMHKKITPDQLKDWITYDGKTFNYDEDAVLAFTEELENKYNTAYSEREFKTSLGTTIYVGRGENDSYAGWMVDEEETYNSILAAVESETESDAKVAWLLAGYTLDENGDDIGGTYIEISVPAQHMWYYENHNLVLETDVVTGLENDPNRRTPRGLFYLLQMSSPYVMHGDYGQQPCEYFIKVTWDGVAIHDAPWQAAFGGDRYLTAGSHGCINTPFDIVSSLWDHLDALEDWQIPVIIY